MEHVSLNTWIQYYSGSIGIRENAVMYAHICDCPACRAIFDQGAKVRRAMAAAEHSRRSGRAGAYRAVAAPQGGSIPEKPAGSIRVRLAGGERGASFLINTLETRGSGNKYALNAEEDDRVLRDDCDLLILELGSGSLTIRTEQTLTAFARIQSENTEGSWTLLDHSAALPLPEGEKRILEIFFVG